MFFESFFLHAQNNSKILLGINGKSETYKFTIEEFQKKFSESENLEILISENTTESLITEEANSKSVNCVIFLEIKQGQDFYRLFANLIDVPLNEKTVFTSDRNSTEELYFGKNSCVEEISFELQEKLKILFPKKDEVKNSENFEVLNENLFVKNDSSENVLLQDEIKKLQNNCSVYENSMNELKKEISQNSDLENSEEKQRAEYELNLTEEKLNSTKIKIKRLEQVLKNLSDEKKLKSLSNEKKSKLDLISELSRKNYENLNSDFFENSVFLKINEIEEKKSSLIKMHSNESLEIANLRIKAEKEINEKKSEIDGRNFRIAQLSSGLPIQEVTFAREKEKSEIEGKINQQLSIDVLKLQENLLNQKIELYEQISNDYESLNVVKINSLSEELQVYYKNYDGAKYGWPVILDWYFDDVLLYSEEFILPYEFVCGKKIVHIGENGYDDYLDTVDIYERLFLSGEKLFVYEIESNVKPSSEKKSSYDFNVNKINVFPVSNLKIQDENLICENSIKIDSNKTFKRDFYPEKDIDFMKEIILEKEKEEQKKLQNERQKLLEEQQKLEEQKRLEEEKLLQEQKKAEEEQKILESKIQNENENEITDKKDFSWAYDYNAFFTYLGGGITLPFPVQKESFNSDADFFIATGKMPLYSVFQMSLIKCPYLADFYNNSKQSEISEISSDVLIPRFSLGIGTSFRLHFFEVFHPRVFLEIFAGGNYVKSGLANDFVSVIKNDFLWTFFAKAGIDFQIGRNFAIKTNYQYEITTYNGEWTGKNCISAGICVTNDNHK